MTTFNSVADMKLANLAEGQIVETARYYENRTDGGAKYLIKTAAQAALDGDIIDSFGNQPLTNGNVAILFIEATYVKPEQFGVHNKDEKNDQPALQACADYAKAVGLAIQGGGDYYLSSTVTYHTNVISIDYMMHRTLPDFASDVPNDINEEDRTLIRIDTPDVFTMNLRCNNDALIDNCRGIWSSKNNVKQLRSIASGFKVGCLITSYSNAAIECRFVNGGASGKGLVAYAPNATNEINTLEIYGGQYFQNNAGAIDIGDTDNWFATTLNPLSDYHGNDIRIIGTPTLDQGYLRIDRVINVVVDAYIEAGGVSIENAIELGGAFNGSVINIKISGYARDYDYYIKCLGGVNGIEVSNCHSRAITHSALHLTTDQFPYKYYNNTNIGSFTKGQEVHTGIRSGRTGNNVFDGKKTIDVYNLIDGKSFDDSVSVHPYTTIREERGQLYYNNTYFRRFVLPTKNIIGTLDTSARTFTVAHLADCYDFNGGDEIQVAGTGTVNSYIRSVDYATGEITLDSTAGGSDGTGDISQLLALAFLQGWESSAPSRTDVRQGSMVFNRNARPGVTQGWIFNGTSWDVLPNI